LSERSLERFVIDQVRSLVDSVAGATAGAVGAFEVARRIGRQRTRRLVGERALRADAWVQRRGVSGVIGLRLLPVVPFNALNYAFGLSSVRRRDHAIGTAIGIVPGSVAFVASAIRSPIRGRSGSWHRSAPWPC